MGGSVGSTISNVGGRVLGDVATGGLAEFGKKDPFTGLVTNPSTGLANVVPGLSPGTTNTSIGGPFSLNPAQSAADSAAITGLGTQQYNKTMQQLPGEVTNAINQSLPNLEETLNSQHLLNGTALPQELARQSSYFAQNLAQPALQAEQGTQTAALQRNLSLEDFVNQANAAKSIGAQFAPTPPSSKAQAGTLLQGAGAAAPLVKAFK